MDAESPSRRSHQEAATQAIPIGRRRAALAFLASVVVPAALAWIAAWGLQLLGAPADELPIFLTLFVHQDLAAAVLWTALALASLAIAPRLNDLRIASWVAELGRGRRLGLLSAAAAVALAVGAVHVYLRHPLALDESAQVFQARAFAAGRLAGEVPPELVPWVLVPGFVNHFWAVDPTSGRVIATYWPGFAALLAPAAGLGLEWLVNPLLTALALVQLAWLARRLGGDAETSGWAVLLALASPQVMAQGISFYSMTAHQVANLAFVGLLLAPTRRRLFAAGLVGSFALVLHQPVPHAAFALPWLLWLTVGRGLAGRRRDLAWLAAGYLPLALGVGMGWFLFRSEMLSAWTAVHGSSRAAPAGATPLGLLAHYATLAFHLPGPELLMVRLLELVKLALWTVPGLLLWGVAGFRAGERGGAVRRLGWSFVSTWLVFLLVRADQGHGWGNRYVAPALGGVMLLAALEIRRRESGGTWRRLAMAAVILGLLVGVPFRALQMRRFLTDHLAQLPPRVGEPPRLMFLSPRSGYYKQDLLQNDPYLRGEDILLLAHGAEAEAALARRLVPGSERIWTNGRDSVWARRAGR